LIASVERIFSNLVCYFKKEFYFLPIRNDYGKGNFSYPVDFSYWYRVGHYKHFDGQGIPQEKYRKFGKQYNWSKIASYALYYFNEYTFSGKEKYRHFFLDIANFLQVKAIFKDEMALWLYAFPWHGLRANWPSAIAQGEIISIFVRAFLLTNDESYLDLAYGAYEVLKTDIRNGGVLNHYQNDNGVVLEEFPESGINELSHILNGFVFGIIGVYDLFYVAQDRRISLFFEKCVKSLWNHIEKYVVENYKWSLYAYPYENENYVTPVYQSLHISLIQSLYHITGHKKFETIVGMWRENYSRRTVRFRALQKKLFYRLKYRTEM